jgi:tRNA modification GTPase
VSDTITAIATANGVGSISIVRVSGDIALDIAKRVTKKSSFNPRETTLCTIYRDSNTVLDQAVVIYFKAPFSFTGEDIVEFQCHGGTALTQLVIKEIIKSGARYATAGEFSKRAFLNGKIDLSQAEAISKLIEAKSEDAIRLLARQLKGELKEFVDDLKEQLISILAYVEVTIDYAEDELDSTIYTQIERKLDDIESLLIETLDASRRREGELNGYRLSIIGKPNVGKSSLLNRVLNFERAIVSDIEGTTRDTIEESIKIGTHLVKIADTAGIRDTKNSIEKIGIERSIASIEDSDIVLALFDSSKELDEADMKIVDILNSIEGKKVLVVLNKIDLEQKIDTDRFTKFKSVKISCKESVKPLLDELESILNSSSGSDEVTLISSRQIDAVQDALNSIKSAKEPLESQELEIFSFEINEAIKSISSITKPYEYSNMLDKMFGEFCLGK